MHTKKLLLVAALTAPVVSGLLALDWPGSRVKFAPAEGSSSVKTFENKGEFTLDNMSMTMNGNEMPSMEVDMTVSSDQKVVVTDEYVSNRDGSPKKLKRRFDDLANDTAVAFKMEMMGQSQNNDKNIKSKSELSGKTVVFTWDDESKEYKRAFEPAEEGGDLLEKLDEDMDLRALLPQSEVKAGDEWDIDVKSLVTILAPGGNMQFKPEGEEADDDMGMGNMAGMGSMSDFLSEMLEGEAKGKFEGERDADGQKLAVIHVSIKIKSAKDMTEIVAEQMKKGKTPPGVESMSFDSMDIEFELEGEGELLWDLSKGRAHSFELSGPAHMNMDMAMKLTAGGQSLSLEQSMQMSGTTNLSVKVE
jgi:hypothetical protein